MQYIICFMISLIFINFAQKFYKKGKGKLFLIFSFIALIVPSILAGVRDLSVGTDTNVYVIPIFEYFESKGFAAMESSQILEIEIGYAIFNYIISVIVDSNFWILFAIQLFISSFIYANSIYQYKTKGISPVMYMAVYYFMFYNVTLNLSRQAMAIAVIIFANKFLEEKKYFKFIIATVFAATFHRSATFALVLIPLCMMMNLKGKIYYKILTCTVLLLGLLFSVQIIELGIDVGIISLRYDKYVGRYLTSDLKIDFTTIIFKVGIISIFSLFGKKLKNKNSMNELYMFLLIVDFILMQLGVSLGYVQRLAYYIGYMSTFILLPQFKELLVKNDRYKILGNTIVILILVVFWWASFVRGGVGQTYPYIMNIF